MIWLFRLFLVVPLAWTSIEILDVSVLEYIDCKAIYDEDDTRHTPQIVECEYMINDYLDQVNNQ